MSSLPNLTLVGHSSEDEVPVPRRQFIREGAGCSKWSEAEIEIPHRPLRATCSAGSNKHYKVNEPLDQKIKQLKKFSKKKSVDSPLATFCCDHYHFSNHNNQRQVVYIQHPVGTNTCKRSHRDSMSTSGVSTVGTSSVKRLVNVERSSQPNIGPVYSTKKLCKNFTALSLSHLMITAALIPLFTMQSSLSLWGGSNAMGKANYNVHDILPWEQHETHEYDMIKQSIYRIPNKDGNISSIEDDGGIIRSKRDTEDSIKNNKADSEWNRSIVDENPFRNDTVMENTNKSYPRAKYIDQDGSTEAYFDGNVIPGKRYISERSKKSNVKMIEITSKVSKIVKRNQISSKPSDGIILQNAPWESYDETNNNITSFDEDTIRTIHNVDNGSLLLTLLFFMGALSTIYAPFYVQYFGVKSCFIQCYVVLSLFISSHYFPNVYILTLTYTVYGLFVGILSHSKIQFLITLSNKFSMIRTEASQDFISAQFSFLHQLSRIYILAQDIGVMVGATLTYYILQTHLQELNISYLFQHKDNGENVCGSTYCPVVWSYLSDIEYYEEDHVNITSGLSEILTTVTNTTHLDRVSNFLSSISYRILPCKANTLLLSIYLAFTIITAIMSILFIDRIKCVFSFKSHQKRLRFCSIYNTHFRYIEMAVKDSKLQLTAPLSLFIGLERGFMYSDFMKSYVACVIGAQKIPLVLLSTSVLQSVAAFTLSQLLQHVRRLHVMIVGTIFHSCLILVLVLWLPAGDDGAILYVIASAWGVCNAIWNSLVFYALIDLYPESWPGPFAHSYFFRYLGLALSFGLHECVCNYVKFYAIGISLGLAIVSYGYLEIKLKKERRVA